MKVFIKRALSWSIVTLSAVLVFSLGSCKGEKDVYEEIDVEDNRPQVVMLFIGDVLGDVFYNDRILLGADEAAEKENLNITYLYIDNTSKSDAAIKELINQSIVSLNNSEKKTLVILPSTNGVNWLKNSQVLKNKSSNLTIMVLESRDSTENVTSVFLPMYGAAYMAGKVMRERYPDSDSLLILMANDKTPTLTDISQGFTNGIESTDTKMVIDKKILSDGEEGFNMDETLYVNAHNGEYNQYDMILPVCGHSIQGLLRYNRENPYSFLTIGMDIDMSPYNILVPLSITKDMETLTYDLVVKWNKGVKLPQHLTYGLESGYVGVKSSSSYKTLFENRLKELKSEGIAKEKEYEAGQ